VKTAAGTAVGLVIAAAGGGVYYTENGDTDSDCSTERAAPPFRTVGKDSPATGVFDV
jgi:hypothetical protein